MMQSAGALDMGDNVPGTEQLHSMELDVPAVRCVKAPGAIPAANLAAMFHDGDFAIARKRTDNLFKQLDERQLTDEEQGIIQRRVELQRKLFQEFEKRERSRKIQELLDVCPDLNQDTATQALELCGWKEEEAAVRFTSDPLFRRRVLGADAAPPAALLPFLRNSATHQSAGPVIPRPRLVDASALQQGHVFVGAFRGRLGPTQMAQQLQKLVDKGVLGCNGRPMTQPSGGPPTDAVGTGVHDPPAAAGPSPCLTPRPEPLQLPQPPASGTGDEKMSPRGRTGDNGDDVCIPDADHAAAGRSAARADTASDAALHVVAPAPQRQVDQAASEELACRGGVAECEEGEFEWGPSGIVYSSQEGQQVVRVCMREAQLAALVQRAVQEAHDLVGLEEPDAGEPPPGFPAAAEAAAGSTDGAAAPAVGPAGSGTGAPGVAQLGAVSADGAVVSRLQHRVGRRSARRRPPTSRAWADQLGLVSGPAGNHPALTRRWEHMAGHILSAPARLRGARLAAVPNEQLPDVIEALKARDAQAAQALLCELGYAAEPPASEDMMQRESTPPESVATVHAALHPLASSRGAAAGGQAGRAGASSSGGTHETMHGSPPQQQQQGCTGGGLPQGSETVTASPACCGMDMDSDAAAVGRGVDSAPGTCSGDDREGSSGSEGAGAGRAMTAKRRRVSGSGGDCAPGTRRRAVGLRASARQARAAVASLLAEDAMLGSPGGADDDTSSADVNGMDHNEETTSSPSPAHHGRHGSGDAAGHLPRRSGRQAARGAREFSPLAAGSDTAPSTGYGNARSGAPSAQGAAGGVYVTLGSMLLATRRGSGTARSAVAISARGHTNRGRVKQKGAKRAELLSVGDLRLDNGWFNAGYIFPDGFKSRTIFRSSVELAAVCVHECSIVGEGGAFWPLPTFMVRAMDRPDEPLVAKSCTGCWSQVLKRINREIETRRAAGEDLPPAPKTAIAGPEYFGFNQAEVVAAVEGLDPQHLATEYWVGKEDRFAMMEGSLPVAAGPSSALSLPLPAARPLPPAPSGAAVPTAGAGGRGRGGAGAAGGGGRGGRGRRAAAAADVEVEDPEDGYAGNRWGAIDRAQRYRRRRAEDGGGAGADDDHPLPDFLDPITLELVVNPAISPFGHVMGMATWRAVLSEHKRCPFTKQPLAPEQLVVLTKNNIERYRDRIVSQ